MSRRFSIAVLGGTFDRLHAGHRALLTAALEAADQIGVGLTTAGYLRRHTKPLGTRIEAYDRRLAALRATLRRMAPERRWWIAPLENAWGRSVEPGIEAIVATPETAAGVASVNSERRRRRLPPLEVITVPLVLGSDGLPVSSRRIRAGLVNADGRRRAALPIGVEGARRDLRKDLTGALRASLPRARPVFGPVPPDRRFRGLATAEAAADRRARQALGSREYGLGIVRVSAGRGADSAPDVWVMSLRDAVGPVGPPMLVAAGEWRRALQVALADRRSPVGDA